MLTRRSRKEAATSPNAVDKPAKTKKSTTPRRSKSKSIDRSVRARSRSSLSKRQVPKVILERFDKKVEEKLKKDTKSNFYISFFIIYFYYFILLILF